MNNTTNEQCEQEDAGKSFLKDPSLGDRNSMYDTSKFNLLTSVDGIAQGLV